MSLKHLTKLVSLTVLRQNCSFLGQFILLKKFRLLRSPRKILLPVRKLEQICVSLYPSSSFYSLWAFLWTCDSFLTSVKSQLRLESSMRSFYVLLYDNSILINTLGEPFFVTLLITDVNIMVSSVMSLDASLIG